MIPAERTPGRFRTPSRTRLKKSGWRKCGVTERCLRHDLLEPRFRPTTRRAFLVMITRPLPFGGTILSILSYQMTNRQADATTNRKSLQAISQRNASVTGCLLVHPTRHVRSSWSKRGRQVHSYAHPGHAAGSRQRQRSARRHRRAAPEGRSPQAAGLSAAGVRALSQGHGGKSALALATPKGNQDG